LVSAAAPSLAIGKYRQLGRDRLARLELAAYPYGRPKDPRKTQHSQGYWYDPEAAERVVIFIETLCHHSKGEWRGQLIRLEDWQKDELLRPLFGWMRADGTRLFRIAYVEMARKNAKSTLGAAVGLYLLAGDQEGGAEVYSSATKRDQARIVHDAAVAMVKASPELRRWVKPQRLNLSCARLGAKFEPLSSDSKTLDGLNPHGNIVDELHAHKDRTVWDVLDTGMGARRQPLTFGITTGGTYEPESIGWQLHEHAIKVLEGVLEDDAFFTLLCCADPEDDWRAPATWAKANPNLGVSVREEFLAAQCRKAEQQPSFQNEFLRKHLNLWTQQQDRWLPIEQWNACDQDRPRDWHLAREQGLAGKPCYAGLDLSTKLDLTALVLAFEPDPGLLELLCRFWVPEATITKRSRQDRVPYDAWARDGWLTATPGDVVDYDFIRSEVVALGRRFAIQEIAFDPWNATQIATQLTGEGFQMVEVRQGYKSLSEPSKEFEKLIMAGRVRHAGHPVLRWMVSNVSLRRDPNDNIAPDKSTSGDRIDGVAAAIMALSRQIVHPAGAGGMFAEFLDLEVE
jgi:phage terminase large subunit-like protein